ncbi:20368_t:CDS:2, partial [Gigaspora margarita]
FVWDCSGVLVFWSAIGRRLVGCVADVVSLVGVLETGSSSISIMFGQDWLVGCWCSGAGCWWVVCEDDWVKVRSGCLKRLGDGTKLESVDSIVCAIGDLEAYEFQVHWLGLQPVVVDGVSLVTFI